jgi:hypothetical protein
MVLVKLLERRDASSLIVAIAAGMAVSQFVSSWAYSLVDWILNDGSIDFVDHILVPLAALVVVFLILEGLARLTIAARGEVSKR